MKTPKTPVFVFITGILWRTFWHNNWRSVFDVVKVLHYFVNLFENMNFNLNHSWFICNFLAFFGFYWDRQRTEAQDCAEINFLVHNGRQWVKIIFKGIFLFVFQHLLLFKFSTKVCFNLRLRNSEFLFYTVNAPS